MSAAFSSPTGSCLVAGFLLGAAIAGCGPSSTPQSRVIKYDYDPVEAVRTFLTNYRDGRPVMSERELFPKLVEEIRKTDPDKAALVEAGLDAIVKSPAIARVEANKLLEKL